jgi:hypothetical protein
MVLILMSDLFSPIYGNAEEELSPIILFVYNRPWHTEHTVEALKKNELASESDLFIFSDGPKVENDENVRKVREYIKTVDGFKSVKIIEREKNIGLANSVIAGVTEVVNKYGKVIVLEDDIVTSKYFLKFMNDGLSVFENDSFIKTVTGDMPFIYRNRFSFPFLTRKPSSWGWGVWERSWKEIEWDVEILLKRVDLEDFKNKINIFGNDFYGMLIDQKERKVDSWGIRCYTSFVLNGGFHLSSHVPLVSNIGLDGSGVHCSDKGIHYNKKDLGNEILMVDSEKIRKNLIDEFDTEISLKERIIIKIQNILSKKKQLNYKNHSNWKNNEYFDESWKERIYLLSTLIKKSDKSIVDLGCGKEWLREYLPENIKYIPVDYKKRSEDTMIYDFNKKEFPDIKADVAFISGTFEYVNDFEWFLTEIKNKFKAIIISYCDTDFYPLETYRKSLNWVNHLSREEFIENIYKAEFILTKEIDSKEHLLLRFDKERKNESNISV